MPTNEGAPHRAHVARGAAHVGPRRAVEIAIGSRTRILVNDRTDVALAASAAGVHLRSDSIPAGRLRQAFGTSILIGASCHSLDDIAQNQAADFKRTNSFEFINLNVDNTTAWVTYRLQSVIIRDGKQTTVQWLETVVLVKERKLWKVKHLHSTLLKRS